MRKINKNQLWRKTPDYRKWRIKVIRRDKVCQVCGTIKQRQAHHLNHATYFPDERFDVNNGICLCDECHKIFHTSFKRSYRQKSTRYDNMQFIELLKRLKNNNICEKLDAKHLETVEETLKA